MKICIIGTGYVGLTEGLCLADLGHDINCHDIVEEKIESLKKGIPTLYEENIEELLKKNLSNKKIKFTTNLKEALDNVKVIFVCVNTPENPKTGEADLTALMSSAKSIAENINPENEFFLVIKSTVPVGTSKLVRENIEKTNPKLRFKMVSNPEFSRQGTAIQDFSKPDRIIVGIDDEKSKKAMEEVYKPITDQGYPIFFSSIETSELIKYASNTFLATKIAFINEIADVCEKTGANIEEISKAMGMDKRISPYFLTAGPGIGGSCFPKDSIALSKIGKKLGLNMQVINSVVSSNIERKNNLAKRILEAYNGDLKNKKIALLGLTYKADTDDTRYSPALNIIEELSKKGVKINAYDPKGMEKAKQMLSKEALASINFFNDPYSIFNNVELLVIATEWNEFKKLDYEKIYNLLNKKIILDFRNILDKTKMEKIGYKYISIGKK